MPVPHFRRWLRRALRLVAAIVGGAILILVAVGGFLYQEFSRDVPETFFDDPVQQFKYGSTGGEILAGLPVGIFKAMPKLCPDYLHGNSWRALGLTYEPGLDRPVGTSLRHSLGFDRIALNCAACHVGTYRPNPQSKRVIVAGMPANRLDLGRFTRFVIDCVTDERFNPWQVEQAVKQTGVHYSWLQWKLLKYAVVPAMREAVLLLQYRFRFLGNEPAPGPGRFDTFNPEKALLNWPFEMLPGRETIGLADFPSLWLQGPRADLKMHLHWDGNNDAVEERNHSAAFGTGAVPTTFDRKSMDFVADWLRTDRNLPPKYPFPIDAARAAQGKPLYEHYCASCHGMSGRDFDGGPNGRVGQVTPITDIRTDPCRLDNYTHALSAEQGNLYAAYPTERFSHFRKTDGYANLPLDGIWLRAPYLHNGSVPTVRDLLNRSDERPKVFYRGYDVIDQEKLGFVSDVPLEDGIPFFRFETQCVGPECAPADTGSGTVCLPGPWAGNSNNGHEGPAYGTELSPEQKDAIVEYLKTF
jgi:mono/diheme cytochrome c family protein